MHYEQKILASGEVIRKPVFDFNIKAKVKSTGKIVGVDQYGLGFYASDDNCYNEDELDFVNLTNEEKTEANGIDWEQRRYEIAKDMLAAIESNSNPQMFVGNPDEQVKWAIIFADELIKQLKEK